MIKKAPFLLKIILSFAFYFFTSHSAFSQAELEPWGNISGIRVDGQLMQFETNLSVVSKGWTNIKATGKERQKPHFLRKANQQIVSTNIDSLYFTQIVEDKGKDNANVSIRLRSKADESLEGVFFTLLLPAEYYTNGTIQLNNSKIMKLEGKETSLNKYLHTSATSVQFKSKKRQLKITFAQATSIIIKNIKAKNKNVIAVFVSIKIGDIKSGQVVDKNYSIKASGVIDKSPVVLTLNTSETGRAFDGLGGNFRLQNPKTDPKVIDYCLNNLNVRWSRVEMPWQLWQPDINEDPISEAQAGKLNLHVQKSMEMAQRLYKMGIPVILSAWSAPSWAIIGAPKFQPGADGVWGNPLDKTKTNEIYKSIADYIVYLKEKYGVEISMFSFNESDLGINIRQTGVEHAELIKGLGAYFVSRGLKTKLLLGDNSDATTYEFIYPALNDPATHSYIGAISFHSWRGWDTETLKKWSDAATELKLPLIVAEGSIDAQAWSYPAIFEEPTYALKEINLYTRLLSICQPESILQWQLTADYSLLAGVGIFGSYEPLHPTQRFWNLKQLSSTPKDLKAMPIHSTATNVSCAALGDNEKNIYAIHLVNNGTTRKVTLIGIPQKVKSFRIYITDKKRAMEKGKTIAVNKGTAIFTLDETSYTSLFSE